MIPPLFFPRKPFTHDTYTEMASGFAPHRSLFGPRRIGKTWWLLHDLGPKAIDYGHRTVYVDFWERGPAPLALLLYELDKALQRKSAVGTVLSRAGQLAPRVKLSALGQEVEIDLTQKPKALPEDQVLLLDQYLNALASGPRPAFLFFDEFQEIGKSKGGPALFAALRASMNRYGAGLAVVFTGSSPDALKRVFSSRKAPFYRFASPLTLPDLGEDFLRHQLGFYPKQAPTITLDDARMVFRHFGDNPEYFQRWMRMRAVTPDLPHADVIRLIEADLHEELDFEQTWLDLNDTDRLVLRLIAEGLDEIYSEAAASRMTALGASTVPGSSSLQTALNKLSGRNLALAWEQDRDIADPVFRDWILARPEADFAR
ncbi:AAA family ATPase [Tropicibacter sp. S64]|uniref:AAA family ATPase n=1 Tax=Tropicibacter sp. S64 TaxID=3415122 RepID=UPI003C7A20C4